MPTRRVRFLLPLALLGAMATAGDARADAPVAVVDVREARIRAGDDLRWAQPDWNDADWDRLGGTVASGFGELREPGVSWLRFRVDLASSGTLGLVVSAVAAREVYWDGVRLGAAGQVGADEASEVAGPLDLVLAVPDSLATPGRHVIAVRMSTFRRPAALQGPLLLSVQAAPLVDLLSAPMQTFWLPMVFLGGFLLVALYYGALFVADRHRGEYLLTSLLCLSVAALLVAESWRPLVGYDYDLHLVRLRIVSGLTVAVGLLLSATFVVQFRHPRAGWILGGLAAVLGVVLLLPEVHDTETHRLFVVALLVVLGITVWARRRRLPGAGVALFGVGVCAAVLVATGDDFMDTTFFPAFGVLLAGLLVSLGLQTREARQRFEAARAEAVRLEAELLKKHLQPHFLMNSLTSVAEWIETDPAVGVRALDALAGELRALSDVSGERLIPMARELALCRAHLDVMGYRRDVRFHLDADGVDPESSIPPAVLHTLIENAVTHNAYPPGDVRLTLRETRDDGQRRLTLRAPLAGPPRETPREGGGLRYVRARLAEGIDGPWSLRSEAERDAWVTHIDLPLS
ncbi:MAG: histidine kinase [Bacteroidota bacterium]